MSEATSEANFSSVREHVTWEHMLATEYAARLQESARAALACYVGDAVTPEKLDKVRKSALETLDDKLLTAYANKLLHGGLRPTQVVDVLHVIPGVTLREFCLHVPMPTAPRLAMILRRMRVTNDMVPETRRAICRYARLRRTRPRRYRYRGRAKYTGVRVTDVKLMTDVKIMG
jgi:hypothetical protein